MKGQRLRRIPLTCVVKSHSVLSKSRNREINMRDRGEKKTPSRSFGTTITTNEVINLV